VSSETVAIQGDRLKAWLITFVKLSIATIIIGFLVYSGRLDFLEISKGLLHPAEIALAFMIFLMAFVFSTLRWQQILRCVGVNIRLGKLIQFTWIGQFFNNFSIGTIGGDVVKIIYVIRQVPKRKAAVAMTVFIDRLAGIYGLFLTAAVGVLVAPDSFRELEYISYLQTVITLTICASSLAAVALLSIPTRLVPKQLTKLNQIVEFLHLFRKSKLRLASIVLFSFLCHFFSTIGVFILSRTLVQSSEELTFIQLLMVTPLGNLVAALPITPVGIGIGQVAYSKLFEWGGIVSKSLGANLITLTQMVTIAINLLGIIPYLMRHRR
jgi:hypothetical protein